MRELLGPKRFTDLRADLPGTSSTAPPPRPKDLGVVVREPLSPPAATRVYAPSEWGRELEPVLRALGGPLTDQAAGAHRW
ncbi:winged helix-turn-helix transcriptional regulator [Deinococcus aestuarii]|uniref:winged helix-turn-helix transcriptional regulator n=1 Tax=Deinococcus aestuarii TaxID=2774531 RepID=UPI001C0DA915|nr:hypothetical protein [Deinococcus aestuarii]